MSDLTRRQALVGGLSLLAASASSPSLAMASPLSNHGGLMVISPTDEGFDSYLSDYFPAIKENEHYATLRNYLMIVKNTSDRSIRGLEVSWRSDLRGKSLSSKFVRQADTNLKRYINTGTKKLISRNQFALVSPFFVLRRSHYKKLADRQETLNAEIARLMARREQKLQRIATPIANSSIHGVIKGVFYKNKKIWPEENSGLGTYIRVVRNAEHDEAALLLKKYSQATPGPARNEILQQVLAEHKNMSIPQLSSKNARIYRKARKRYARQLLAHLEENSFIHTLRLLQTIKRQRRVKLVAV